MSDPISRLQLARQEIDRLFGLGYAKFACQAPTMPDDPLPAAICAGWSTVRDLRPVRPGAANAGDASDDCNRDALEHRRRHRPRFYYRHSQNHSRETAETPA